MSNVISRLGFHCNGPDRTGYGQCLDTIAAGDRRLACVVTREASHQRSGCRDQS